MTAPLVDDIVDTGAVTDPGLVLACECRQPLGPDLGADGRDDVVLEGGKFVTGHTFR